MTVRNRSLAMLGVFGLAMVGILLHRNAATTQDVQPADELDKARREIKRLQSELDQSLRTSRQKIKELQAALDKVRPAPERGGEIVARLFGGKVAITRAAFGEYLIARHGAERLEFMINRTIVESVCGKHKIVVTDAEVEQRFQEDIRALSPPGTAPLTREQFVNNILRRFGKTEYEWREDVIRPKLMMEKYVASTVKITDNDLREGFEAQYGPKVECRMIVIDKAQGRPVAVKVHANARKGVQQFLDEAGMQLIPGLSSIGGKVPAIHKHFGDKEIEDAAFRLKEGEISRVIEMKDGSYVILMCEKHVPANREVTLEEKREGLRNEMYDLRVAQRIPEVFAELKKEAAPEILMSR